MGSHFVARILGLKKKVLQLEYQRNLVTTLCWVWLGMYYEVFSLQSSCGAVSHTGG